MSRARATERLSCRFLCEGRGSAGIAPGLIDGIHRSSRFRRVLVVEGNETD